MILFTVAATLIVSGCSHQILKYEGQKPNFNLSGEATQQEIKRFELEEDSSICGFPCFKHDAQKRQHTWESIQPLLETVSPYAAQEYQRAKLWRNVQLYSLAVGVAGLFAGLATDGNKRDMLFSLSLAGSVVSIGSSFYLGKIQSNIRETYNRELKEKFVPAVGMAWSTP